MTYPELSVCGGRAKMSSDVCAEAEDNTDWENYTPFLLTVKEVRGRWSGNMRVRLRGPMVRRMVWS